MVLTWKRAQAFRPGWKLTVHLLELWRIRVQAQSFYKVPVFSSGVQDVKLYSAITHFIWTFELPPCKQQ